MGEMVGWIMLALTGVGVVGGIIMRDRHIFRTIEDGDAAVHSRVNDLQVRAITKDELDMRMRAIENGLTGLSDAQRETNKRIDTVLTLMMKRND